MQVIPSMQISAARSCLNKMDELVTEDSPVLFVKRGVSLAFAIVNIEFLRDIEGYFKLHDRLETRGLPPVADYLLGQISPTEGSVSK